MTVWRGLLPALLLGAVLAAIVRSANASAVGRIGGLLAAASLALVGVGVARGQKWALGASFFLGLFWLWAALALGVQGVIDAPEIFMWVAWSVVVMIGSVRLRVP